MSDLTKAELTKLLKDEKLMGEIIDKVLSDPEVVKELAEDIANELASVLKDDPSFRLKLLGAAAKNAKFKQKLLEEVADEIAG